MQAGEEGEEAGEEEVDEDYFENQGTEEKKSTKKKQGAPKQEWDHAEMFKDLFPTKVRGPSVKKLRGDDVHIMKRLIDKYGDNVDRMFMDIKLNYMQWSKGELKIKIKAYKIHH